MVLVFIWTTLAQSAPTDALPLAPVVRPSAVQPQLLKVPASLGTLEDGGQPADLAGPSPLIIHLLDAHANYESQQKTIKLLDYLKTHYGISLVLLEGAQSRLDPGLLDLFREDVRSLKMADYLMRQGEVSGAEYWLLREKNARKPAEAFGVEDETLYRENLLAFRNVYSGIEEAEWFLEYMDARIGQAVAHKWDPAVKRFAKSWKQFERGRLALLPYLKVLSAAAKKDLNLDLSSPGAQLDYPHLARIAKLQKAEPELDAAAFEQEKEKLLAYFDRIALDNRLRKSFREKVAADSRPGTRARKGLRSLFERIYAAAPADFSFRGYPQISLWAGTLILREELDAAGVMEEIGRLSDRIFESRLGADSHRPLLALIKDSLLLEKFFHLELTRAEFEDFDARRETLGPVAFLERVRAAEAGVPRRVEPAHALEESRLERLFAQAAEFYEGARRREAAMVENALRRIREKGARAAVLITGGFHAEGIRKGLLERQAGYAGVTPKLLKLEKDNRYLATVLGRGALPAARAEEAQLKSVLYEISRTDQMRLGADLAERDHLISLSYQKAAAWKSRPSLRAASLGHKALQPRRSFYHYRVDSTVQSYDGDFLLLSPTLSRYNPRRAERRVRIVQQTEDDFPRHSERVAKLRKAVQYLLARAGELGGEQGAAMAERARRIGATTTVIGLHMDTHLFFYGNGESGMGQDEDHKRIGVYHIGRRRSVIYFSNLFLDSLPESEPGAAELAFYLDRAQRWIDDYERITGEITRDKGDAARIYELMAEARRNFAEEDLRVMDAGRQKMTRERLDRLGAEDARIRREVIPPKIRARFEEIALLEDALMQTRAGRKAPDRDDYWRLAQLYGQLGHLQESIGEEADAIRSYRAQVDALQDAQVVDVVGMWPFQIQEDIVRILLKAGLYEEFLAELKIFLKGEGLGYDPGHGYRRRYHPLEKDLLAGEIRDHGRLFEAELLHLFQSQQEEAPAGERVKNEKVGDRIKTLFENARAALESRQWEITGDEQYWSLPEIMSGKKDFVLDYDPDETFAWLRIEFNRAENAVKIAGRRFEKNPPKADPLYPMVRRMRQNLKRGTQEAGTVFVRYNHSKAYVIPLRDNLWMEWNYARDEVRGSPAVESQYGRRRSRDRDKAYIASAVHLVEGLVENDRASKARPAAQSMGAPDPFNPASGNRYFTGAAGRLAAVNDEYGNVWEAYDYNLQDPDLFQVKLANLRGKEDVVLKVVRLYHQTQEGVDKEAFQGETLVGGQVVGHFDFSTEHPRDGVKTYTIHYFFPIDNFGTPAYRRLAGRGISQTVLNWIASRAARESAVITDDGTHNLALAGLYHRYFADFINRPGGGAAADMARAIAKYGFYSRKLFGTIRISSNLNNVYAPTLDVRLRAEKLPDIYSIEQGAAELVGEKISIARTGSVTRLSSGALLGAAAWSTDPYTFQGLPRPVSAKKTPGGEILLYQNNQVVSAASLGGEEKAAPAESSRGRWRSAVKFIGWSGGLFSVIAAALFASSAFRPFLPVVLEGWVLIGLTLAASAFNRQHWKQVLIMAGGIALSFTVFHFLANQAAPAAKLGDIAQGIGVRFASVFAGVMASKMLFPGAAGETFLKKLSYSFKWALSFALITGYFIYFVFFPFLEQNIPNKALRAAFDLGPANWLVVTYLMVITTAVFGEDQNLWGDLKIFRDRTKSLLSAAVRGKAGRAEFTEWKREVGGTATARGLLSFYPVNFIFWFPAVWMIWALSWDKPSLRTIHAFVNFVWIGFLSTLMRKIFSERPALPPAAGGQAPRAQSMGAALERTDPFNPSSRNTYQFDGAGRLLAVRDEDGNVWEKTRYRADGTMESVELLNLKGPETVTLAVREDHGMLGGGVLESKKISGDVYVGGRKTGDFRFYHQTMDGGKDRLFLDAFHPIGYSTSAEFSEFFGQGISQTILNWAARYAALHGLEMVNSGTQSTGLFHLYRRLFADEIKVNRRWHDISGLERQTGLYDLTVFGTLDVVPDPRYPQRNLKMIRLRGNPAEGRYEVLESTSPAIARGTFLREEDGALFSADDGSVLGTVVESWEFIDVRGTPRPLSARRAGGQTQLYQLDRPLAAQSLGRDEYAAANRWERRVPFAPHPQVSLEDIYRAGWLLRLSRAAFGEGSMEDLSKGVFPFPIVHSGRLDALMHELTDLEKKYYLLYLPALPEGSFKPYVAADAYDHFDKLASRDPRLLEGIRRIVAESTGNQGKAVAAAVNKIKGLYPAYARHLKAVIFVPYNATPAKLQAMRILGAVVVRHDLTSDELEEYVANPDSRAAIEARADSESRRLADYTRASLRVDRDLSDNPNAVYYIRHGSRMGIAGYANIGFEGLDQWLRLVGPELGLARPPVSSADQEAFREFVAGEKDLFSEVAFGVPGGSGGLESGIAQVKQLSPFIRVFGTQVPGVDPLYVSLDTDELIDKSQFVFDQEAVRHVDGIAATPERLTFEILRQMSDGVTRVPYRDNDFMTRLIWDLELTYPGRTGERLPLQVEPASLLPLTNMVYHGRLYGRARHILVPVTGRVTDAGLRQEIESIPYREAFRLLRGHSLGAGAASSFHVSVEQESAEQGEYFAGLHRDGVEAFSVVDAGLSARLVSFAARFWRNRGSWLSDLQALARRPDPLALLAHAPNPIFTLAANSRAPWTIRKRIEAVLAAGVPALFIVSGGGLTQRWLGWLSAVFRVWPAKSFRVLRLARALRDTRGTKTVLFAAANPNDPRDTAARLEQKLSAGAEAVLTQPPFLWNRFESWWLAAREKGLTGRASIRVGVPVITSPANLKFWFKLTGIDLKRDAEARALLAEFEAKWAAGPKVFQTFRKEWTVRLIQRIRSDLPDAAGVHLMPQKAWQDLDAILEQAGLIQPVREARADAERLIAELAERGVTVTAEPSLTDGKYVRRFREALAALKTVVEGLPGGTPGFRVTWNWIINRENFRRPVAWRPFDGGGFELAVDLRQLQTVPPAELERQFREALDAAREERTESHAGVRIETDYVPYNRSLVWQFNRNFWEQVAPFMKAFGRDYRQSIGGSPDTNARLVHYTAAQYLEQLVRAGDHPTVYIEVGVASADHARLFLDELARLAAERGLAALLTHTKYVLTDFSDSSLRRARAGLGQVYKGVALEYVHLNAEDPLAALQEKYSGKILRYHATNVFDNLPTDKVARIGGNYYQIGTRLYLPSGKLRELAGKYRLEPAELTASLARLEPDGADAFLKHYRGFFRERGGVKKGNAEFYRFWQDLWNAFKMEEKYFPVADINNFDFLQDAHSGYQYPESGRVLGRLLDGYPADVSMHLSNHGVRGGLEIMELLHPEGALEIVDLVTTEIKDYERFKGPAKYDGSAVDYVNGPLFAALVKHRFPNSEVAYTSLKEFGDKPHMFIMEIHQNGRAASLGKAAEILRPLFTGAGELETAVSLFGDLVLRFPAKRSLLQRLVQQLRAQKKDRPLGAEDFQDLADWMRHFAGDPAHETAFHLSGGKVAYSELSDTLLRRIVKFRLPRKNFRQAYEVAQAGEMSDTRFLGAFRGAKEKLPLIPASQLRQTLVDEDHIPEWQTVRAVPELSGERWELRYDAENGILYFYLRDAGLVSQLQRELPVGRPYMFRVNVARAGDNLYFPEYQPIVRTHPSLSGLPEIQAFLSGVPDEALQYLLARIPQLSHALWPAETTPVRQVFISSAGAVLARHPRISANAAIRYYHSLPPRHGFELVYRNPETGVPDSVGRYLWRRQVPEVPAAASLGDRVRTFGNIDDAVHELEQSQRRWTEIDFLQRYTVDPAILNRHSPGYIAYLREQFRAGHDQVASSDFLRNRRYLLPFAEWINRHFPDHATRALTAVDLGTETGQFPREAAALLREHFASVRWDGTDLGKLYGFVPNAEFIRRHGAKSQDIVSVTAPFRDNVHMMLRDADQLVKDSGLIYFASSLDVNSAAARWLLAHGYTVTWIYGFEKGLTPSGYETYAGALLASRSVSRGFAYSVESGYPAVALSPAAAAASLGETEADPLPEIFSGIQALHRDFLKIKDEKNVPPGQTALYRLIDYLDGALESREVRLLQEDSFYNRRIIDLLIRLYREDRFQTEKGRRTLLRVLARFDDEKVLNFFTDELEMTMMGRGRPVAADQEEGKRLFVRAFLDARRNSGSDRALIHVRQRVRSLIVRRTMPERDYFRQIGIPLRARPLQAGDVEKKNFHLLDAHLSQYASVLAYFGENYFASELLWMTHRVMPWWVRANALQALASLENYRAVVPVLRRNYSTGERNPSPFGTDSDFVMVLARELESTDDAGTRRALLDAIEATLPFLHTRQVQGLAELMPAPWRSALYDFTLQRLREGAPQSYGRTIRLVASPARRDDLLTLARSENDNARKTGLLGLASLVEAKQDRSVHEETVPLLVAELGRPGTTNKNWVMQTLYALRAWIPDSDLEPSARFEAARAVFEHGSEWGIGERRRIELAAELDPVFLEHYYDSGSWQQKAAILKVYPKVSELHSANWDLRQKITRELLPQAQALFLWEDPGADEQVHAEAALLEAFSILEGGIPEESPRGWRGVLEQAEIASDVAFKIEQKVREMFESYSGEPLYIYQHARLIYEQQSARLSPRYRIYFEQALMLMLKDLTLMRRIQERAARLGISYPTGLDGVFESTAAEIHADPEREAFVRDLIGFVPEKFQLHFEPTSVHVVLDRLSYQRAWKLIDSGFSYEVEELSAADSRLFYKGQGSAAVYPEQLPLRFEGRNLPGRTTLQLVTHQGEGFRYHEQAHLRFQHYGFGSNLKRAVLRNSRPIVAWIDEWERRLQASGVEDPDLRARLTEVFQNQLLAFQNEISSRFAEGEISRVLRAGEFDNWFNYYFKQYHDYRADLLSRIHDPQILAEFERDTREIMRGWVRNAVVSLNAIYDRRTQHLTPEDTPQHAGALQWMSLYSVFLGPLTHPAYFEKAEEMGDWPSVERSLKGKLEGKLEAFLQGGIYPGSGLWNEEWSREAMMGVLAVTDLIPQTEGEFQSVDYRREARALILHWAERMDATRTDGRVTFGIYRKEQGRVNGERETADAPLWFVEAVAHYVSRSGDAAILTETVRDGVTLGENVRRIIARYRMTRRELEQRGMPAQAFQSDPETGLIWVPAQHTWMDSPSTPRQGYPVEIQALWINALRRAAELSEAAAGGGEAPAEAAEYRVLAAGIQKGLNEYFWDAQDGYFYDVLGTDGFLTARESAERGWQDRALRPNQIFAIFFDTIDDEAKRVQALGAIKQGLLIPGALRTLAPGTNLPFAKYDPDLKQPDSGKPESAMFNGMGAVWLYPFYYVSVAKNGLLPIGRTKSRMRRHLRPLVIQNERGSLPQFISGDEYLSETRLPYHAQRGNPSWAASVASAIHGMHTLRALSIKTAASLGQSDGLPRTLKELPVHPDTVVPAGAYPAWLTASLDRAIENLQAMRGIAAGVRELSATIGHVPDPEASDLLERLLALAGQFRREGASFRQFDEEFVALSVESARAWNRMVQSVNGYIQRRGRELRGSSSSRTPSGPFAKLSPGGRDYARLEQTLAAINARMRPLEDQTEGLIRNMNALYAFLKLEMSEGEESAFVRYLEEDLPDAKRKTDRAVAKRKSGEPLDNVVRRTYEEYLRKQIQRGLRRRSDPEKTSYPMGGDTRADVEAYFIGLFFPKLRAEYFDADSERAHLRSLRVSLVRVSNAPGPEHLHRPDVDRIIELMHLIDSAQRYENRDEEAGKVKNEALAALHDMGLVLFAADFLADEPGLRILLDEYGKMNTLQGQADVIAAYFHILWKMYKERGLPLIDLWKWIFELRTRVTAAPDGDGSVQARHTREALGSILNQVREYITNHWSEITRGKVVTFTVGNRTVAEEMTFLHAIKWHRQRLGAGDQRSQLDRDVADMLKHSAVRAIHREEHNPFHPSTIRRLGIHVPDAGQSLGSGLRDSALGVLPEEDRRRIDAAARFADHLIRFALLDPVNLERVSAQPGLLDFDSIPQDIILAFFTGLRQGGADFSDYNGTWEEAAARFLSENHPLFSGVKLTPQLLFRSAYEIRARGIPVSEALRQILEGTDRITSFLFSNGIDADVRVGNTSLALQELGSTGNLAWAAGAFDRIALYAEGEKTQDSTWMARHFIHKFIDSLFDSEAMAHAFVFNRSLVEAYLDPVYAEREDVGIVYLLSGSSHLYDDAFNLAKEYNFDTSRVHALYFNRRIAADDPAILEEYLRQEKLARYKTLIVVDTGFHGNSAAALEDVLNRLAAGAQRRTARLLVLNEEQRTHGSMQMTGWNHILGNLGAFPSQKHADAMVFIAHLLDNVFPAHHRSPVRLAREEGGLVVPALAPTELPRTAKIVSAALDRGWKRLRAERLPYPHLQNQVWERWFPAEALARVRQRAASLGEQSSPAPVPPLISGWESFLRRVRTFVFRLLNNYGQLYRFITKVGGVAPETARLALDEIAATASVWDWLPAWAAVWEKRAAAEEDVLEKANLLYLAMNYLVPRTRAYQRVYARLEAQLKEIYPRARRQDYIRHGQAPPRVSEVLIPFRGQRIPAYFVVPPSATVSASIPVVVLFHGMMHRKEQPYLDGMERELIGRGFAVLRVDLPGHGENPFYAGKPAELDAFLDGLSGYLASGPELAPDEPRVDGQKLALFGFSFGGYLGLRALLSPSIRRLRAVVSMNPPIRHIFRSIPTLFQYRKYIGSALRENNFLQLLWKNYRFSLTPRQLNVLKAPASRPDRQGKLLIIASPNDAVIGHSEFPLHHEIARQTGGRVYEDATQGHYFLNSARDAAFAEAAGHIQTAFSLGEAGPRTDLERVRELDGAVLAQTREMLRLAKQANRRLNSRVLNDALAHAGAQAKKGFVPLAALTGVEHAVTVTLGWRYLRQSPGERLADIRRRVERVIALKRELSALVLSLDRAAVTGWYARLGGSGQAAERPLLAASIAFRLEAVIDQLKPEHSRLSQRLGEISGGIRRWVKRPSSYREETAESYARALAGIAEGLGDDIRTVTDSPVSPEISAVAARLNTLLKPELPLLPAKQLSLFPELDDEPGAQSLGSDYWQALEQRSLPLREGVAVISRLAREKNKRPVYIGLDGPIGVGKSSLAEVFNSDPGRFLVFHTHDGYRNPGTKEILWDKVKQDVARLTEGRNIEAVIIEGSWLFKDADPGYFDVKALVYADYRTRSANLGNRLHGTVPGSMRYVSYGASLQIEEYDAGIYDVILNNSDMRAGDRSNRFQWGENVDVFSYEAREGRSLGEHEIIAPAESDERRVNAELTWNIARIYPVAVRRHKLETLGLISKPVRKIDASSLPGSWSAAFADSREFGIAVAAADSLENVRALEPLLAAQTNKMLVVYVREADRARLAELNRYYAEQLEGRIQLMTSDGGESATYAGFLKLLTGGGPLSNHLRRQAEIFYRRSGAAGRLSHQELLRSLSIVAGREAFEELPSTFLTPFYSEPIALEPAAREFAEMFYALLGSGISQADLLRQKVGDDLEIRFRRDYRIESLALNPNALGRYLELMGTVRAAAEQLAQAA